MKHYERISQIKAECKKVESCTSQSDGFMYKCFPFICEKLQSIDENLKLLRKAVKKNVVMKEFIEAIKLLEEQ